MGSVLEGWVRCRWSWGLCALFSCFPYKGTVSAKVAWADTCAGCCSVEVWDVVWLCEDAGREQYDVPGAG